MLSALKKQAVCSDQTPSRLGSPLPPLYDPSPATGRPPPAPPRSLLPQHGEDDGHHGPHTILGLRERQRLVAVEHLIRDLLLVPGQAVQEHRVRRRLGHHRRVHLIAGKVPQPDGGLLLLPHADPGVCDHHIAAGHGLQGVGRHQEARAVVRAELLGERGDAGVRPVALRGGHAHVHAHLGRAEHQVVQHVVPVANPGQRLARQVLPEVLLQGEQVSQGLQRVVQVRERVDHGHGRVLRQLLDIRVCEHAGKKDAVEPRQNLRRVQHALVHPQLDVAGAEEERMPAEQRHARLRADTSASRALLKYHS
mmetsp:Transcript_28152/g.50976  ORF Transcript_28152/g.50976 Transcript_28152/m.50976 type:complete len:308 (+) Transcript_28152:126-1049(+)